MLQLYFTACSVPDEVCVDGSAEGSSGRAENDAVFWLFLFVFFIRMVMIQVCVSQGTWADLSIDSDLFSFLPRFFLLSRGLFSVCGAVLWGVCFPPFNVCVCAHARPCGCL